jgi:hypothetical protein
MVSSLKLSQLQDWDIDWKLATMKQFSDNLVGQIRIHSSIRHPHS